MLSSGPTSVSQQSWVCGWSCVQDLISVLNGIWAAYRGNTIWKFFLECAQNTSIVIRHPDASFSWLLQDEGMHLRTTCPGFVEAVNLYFDKLISMIKPLMVSLPPSSNFWSVSVRLNGEKRALLLSVWRGRPYHRRAGGEWIWVICQRQQLHAVYKGCECPTGNCAVFCFLFFKPPGLCSINSACTVSCISFSVSKPEASRSSCWLQTTGRAWDTKGWRVVNKGKSTETSQIWLSISNLAVVLDHFSSENGEPTEAVIWSDPAFSWAAGEWRKWVVRFCHHRVIAGK